MEDERNYKTILVISDLHTPYHHPDSFKFLDHLNEKYKPTKIVNIGDEIDHHSISFHDKDPDLPFSPSSELEKAIWHLKDMYLIFPRMEIMESNHGSLVYRKGKHAGLPRAVFKSYREIIEAPKNYTWHDSLILTSGGRKIMFHHSLGKNALKNSQHESMCYVQGHWHGQADIQWWANTHSSYWGMTVGCSIDFKSYAFAYGRSNLPKPVLSHAVIVNGTPVIEPMILDKDGRWCGKSI